MMLIHELAKHTGLSRDTIRFYEKMGLIQAQRATNGYRHYTEQMAVRLQLIKLAKSLGFQLSEITALVQVLDEQQQLSAEHIQQCLEEKISEIEEKLHQLQALKDLLQGILKEQICPIDQQCMKIQA